MSRTTALGCLKVVAAAVWLVTAAVNARAVYLDEGQNWALRMRAYSQAAIRLQDSRSDKVFSAVTGDLAETQTVPETSAGNLVQNRFFFNPELDVKLTPYLNWMGKGWLKWLSPDDLRMRVAGWGFYDGLYDYGPDRFNRTQKQINENFDPFVPFSTRPDRIREGGWYIESSKIVLDRRASGNVVAHSFADIFPTYKLKDPRDHYSHQRRINEFYLSYSKGPLFVRAGKQTISWGESDTIALLDQMNPFSVLLGAPGFFQDIDEARIPLWTLRTSYDLFSNLGPFSSGFVEGYWVPGDLDTTTGKSPILTASPYSAAGPDPGRGNPIFPSTYQFVFVDQIPEKKFDNSRYGFRFQTVYDRFLTMQAWFYRTFPQQPVPLKIGLPDDGSRNIQVEDSNGRRTDLFILSLQRPIISVYGLAGTFFTETLDGIVRLNVQYFENEPGFIPNKNLRIQSEEDNAITGKGELPRADIIRYEIGFDRFFFFRPLNPTNSFILSSSITGFWNMTHTGSDDKDFRFAGLQKRGIKCDVSSTDDADTCRAQGGNPVQRGSDRDDYVQQKEAEAQAQITLQSDWLHGTINGRLTTLAFTRGTWAVKPTVTYRWSDWLLFGAEFQWIGGDYQSLGIFQDRGQVALRVTYQLN